VWRAHYLAKQERAEKASQVQILRNFENAIKKVGGTTLYVDQGRETLKVEKDGKELWVEVLADHTGGHQIWVVEKEAMKQDVVANAEASANLSRFDGVRFGHRSERAATVEELYVASRGEGFGEEVKRRIMLGTFALSSGYYDAYYGRAQSVRERLRHQLAALFDRFDFLITPTTPEAAFPIGAKTADPLSMYLSDVFTAPANLAGLPAIAVPSGFDSRGLPLSLQIMAPHFGEAAMFRAAAAFERETEFWRRLPAVHG
jgi:Asp-tRNA(Asn)/Glu-tRNA(Gln) amidotransferase A subunit family amidase